MGLFSNSTPFDNDVGKLKKMIHNFLRLRNWFKHEIGLKFHHPCNISKFENESKKNRNIQNNSRQIGLFKV